MKLKEWKAVFNDELKNIYSSEEAQTILKYIFIDALGFPKLTILSQPELELSAKQSETIYSLLKDLKKGIPIQHLLGVAHFYGMMLKVTPDVLIPRQETEELVDWIIKENIGTKLKLLDACTGSGCIALALKRHLPESDITAIDVSEKALDIAKWNAKRMDLDINFKNANALNLKEELKGESFDIVVSNPPYIPTSDKDTVQKSVWMYEPHMALFVPDATPLIFYESIAKYAKTNKPIKLYFEINEDFGDEVTELMSNMVFKDIIIKSDLNGKKRMLRCHNF